MSKSKFKCNDIVMVAPEGAWSRILDGDSIDTPLKRVGGYLDCRAASHQKFKVIATNCHIPIVENCTGANTLIQDLDTKQVIAINDVNLFTKPNIEIKYVTNGKDVTNELSDQSKQAVLRANLQ